MGTVLYNLAESLRFISVLISPFMPTTPDRIRQQLGIEGLEDLQSWDSLSQFGKSLPVQRYKEATLSSQD